MRTIKRTAQFKRDYKREKRGRHRNDVDERLYAVVQLLMTDSALPERMHDHSLSGNLKDCRDCHIKPDLVLIYRKTKNAENYILELIHLGSHAELNI